MKIITYFLWGLLLLSGCSNTEGLSNISDDGIFYKVKASSTSEIYFTDGTSTRKVDFMPRQDSNLEISTPVWSESARFFLVTVSTGDDSDIYSITKDLSGTLNLTNTSDIYETNPLPSPDGEYIVFERFELKSDIWLMRINGTGQENLTAELPGSSSASWSKDSLFIYFSSLKEGTPNIYRINVNTKKLENISKGQGMDGAYSLSPDSKSLVFDSDRDNYSDLFLVNLETMEIKNITSSPFREVEPAFSPDGSKVLYRSTETGGWDYYYLELDTLEKHQLTNMPNLMKANAIWGRSSDKIIFNMEIDGFQDLISIKLSDKKVTNLTNTKNIDEFAPKLFEIGE